VYRIAKLSVSVYTIGQLQLQELTPVSLLTVSAAARQWNVSRSWLYNLRDKGRLSFSAFPDGSPGIDSAELLRAIGEPRVQTASAEQLQELTVTDAGQTETAVPGGPALSVLQAQLEAAQRALAESKDNERQALEAQLEAALDREKQLLALLATQTKLLEHQQAPGEARKETLWEWLNRPRGFFSKP